MAWVKLDDSMPHHPKIIAAGPVAFALDVAGICYSNRYATDGFISQNALKALLPAHKNLTRAAEKLVEVGRWRLTEGGWIIHDIEDYQPTAEEQKALSRKRSQAGRIGGVESGKARRDEPKAKQVASDPEATAKQVASTESNPDPTRPDTSPKGDGNTGGGNNEKAPLFEAFYQAWHNKPWTTDTKLTKAERGRINQAVKQALADHLTADEVRQRATRYRRDWPAIECTPQALLSNWTRFDGSSDPPEPFDAANCEHPDDRRAVVDDQPYCGACGKEIE